MCGASGISFTLLGDGPGVIKSWELGISVCLKTGGNKTCFLKNKVRLENWRTWVDMGQLKQFCSPRTHPQPPCPEVGEAAVLPSLRERPLTNPSIPFLPKAREEVLKVMDCTEF